MEHLAHERHRWRFRRQPEPVAVELADGFQLLLSRLQASGTISFRRPDHAGISTDVGYHHGATDEFSGRWHTDHHWKHKRLEKFCCGQWRRRVRLMTMDD